jgi:hypothetical protein
MEPIKEEKVRYPLSMPLNACRAALRLISAASHCSLPAITLTRIHYHRQSCSSPFLSLLLSRHLVFTVSHFTLRPNAHRVAVQRELVREGGEKPVE